MVWFEAQFNSIKIIRIHFRSTRHRRIEPGNYKYFTADFVTAIENGRLHALRGSEVHSLLEQYYSIAVLPARPYKPNVLTM